VSHQGAVIFLVPPVLVVLGVVVAVALRMPALLAVVTAVALALALRRLLYGSLALRLARGTLVVLVEDRLGVGERVRLALQRPQGRWDDNRWNKSLTSIASRRRTPSTDGPSRLGSARWLGSFPSKIGASTSLPSARSSAVASGMAFKAVFGRSTRQPACSLDPRISQIQGVPTSLARAISPFFSARGALSPALGVVLRCDVVLLLGLPRVGVPVFQRVLLSVVLLLLMDTAVAVLAWVLLPFGCRQGRLLS
jgi:hypothetical protein